MNSWYKNKKSFAVLFIILILVIVSLMVANIAKAWIQKLREEEAKKAEEVVDLYNASRYFFRVYYPIDWAVNGGTNGFMINSNTGLVLEAFPLVENPVTPRPTVATSPSATPTLSEGQTVKPTATPDPREGMVRYQYASARFYYREYTDFGIEKKDPATIAPDHTPNITATPNVTSTPQNTGGQTVSPTVFDSDTPVTLEDAFEAVRKYIDAQDYLNVTYEINEGEILELGGKRFGKATYTYSDVTGMKYKCDVYVAVRKMAYYVITFEAVENNEIKAYTKYSDEFEGMIEDMLFSVFDY